MKFRLTYNGDVLSSHSKRDHKHAIRKVFHSQIRRLLDHRVHKSVMEAHPANLGFSSTYNFVPLVWKLKYPPECSLDILFLNRHSPGKPIHAGDIDNRLKTILDALRIPSVRQELPDSAAPEPDEDPFFCLLEDDKLVTHMSVETDQWFEPTIDGGASPNEALVIVKVSIEPGLLTKDGALHL